MTPDAAALAREIAEACSEVADSTSNHVERMTAAMLPLIEAHLRERDETLDKALTRVVRMDELYVALRARHAKLLEAVDNFFAGDPSSLCGDMAERIDALRAAAEECR